MTTNVGILKLMTEKNLKIVSCAYTKKNYNEVIIALFQNAYVTAS